VTQHVNGERKVRMVTSGGNKLLSSLVLPFPKKNELVKVYLNLLSEHKSSKFWSAQILGRWEFLAWVKMKMLAQPFCRS
jgi:hypothetical protein